MDTEIMETRAVKAKSNQKLSMLKRVEDSSVASEAEHSLILLNHAFSISLILSPSVTFKIALEISGTNADPIGKPCPKTSLH